MKRTWLLLFCPLVCIGLSMACSSAADAKTIKIGIVDTYSGPSSLYTNDVRDALTMIVDKANAAGGILGNKIEIITRDDNNKVDVGLSQAKELLMKEQVDIMVGTINSALSLAVSDLCKKEKIPFLVTLGKSDNITGANGHRYVFSVTENTAMIGRAAAAALATKPYVKYWIAGSDYEYGHALVNELWPALKKLKPEAVLLGESWWKLGEPDFTPYITAILPNQPDCIILATGGRDSVPFLKAARATSLNEKIPLFMHAASDLVKVLGAEGPEGVLATDTYHSYYPETPLNKGFVKEFGDRFKREPNLGGLSGYLAAEFILKAYEKAGKIDPEKFVDALEGLTIPSPVGDVTMRAFDHQVILPMFTGVTRKAPNFDYLIASDLTVIPGDRLMPPVEEIEKARASK